MNIHERLKARQLPPLRSREEMVNWLMEHEYGYKPEIPYEITVSEPEVLESRYCAGLVEYSQVNMTVTTAYGSHTFPIQRMLYNDGQLRPVIICLNFFPTVPNQYYPAEEVAESGVNVLHVCYKDVISDDDDFTNGLAGIFLPNGQCDKNTCGKITLWAWTASRVLDYACGIPGLDVTQAAVMGHSRLGKTALVAGMLDQRFRYVYSNDSGCSGASLSRGSLGQTGAIGPYGGKGESIDYILQFAKRWFCHNYTAYTDTNMSDEFDQHYLLATIAPRFVYVASADMDDWADPDSEFLSCLAASPAYEKLGLKGLVCGENLPAAPDAFHEGRIGYHRRHGKHFLSRYDWNQFIAFMKQHRDDVV